jgi:hypothetical protein
MTYRDDRPVCLTCGAGLVERGPLWICDQCHSKLLPPIDLQDQLNEVSLGDWRELAARLLPATRPGRQCPRCATVMTASTIYDLPFEVCASHGVWCDRLSDLEVVERNARAYDRIERPINYSNTVLGLLTSAIGSLSFRRRLRRHIARTSPAGTQIA